MAQNEAVRAELNPERECVVCGTSYYCEAYQVVHCCGEQKCFNQLYINKKGLIGHEEQIAFDKQFGGRYKSNRAAYLAFLKENEDSEEAQIHRIRIHRIKQGAKKRAGKITCETVFTPPTGAFMFQEGK